MNAEQNYDPTPGSATPCGQTAQNSPQTGFSTTPAAYGTWPVDPPLHRPAANRLVIDASTLATYSALNLKHLGSRYAEVCDALADEETGPISVVEPLTQSLMRAADFRQGKALPALPLITWLATVHPQINLDYLFRGEGEPLLPTAPVLHAPRLTGDALQAAITQLTDRLYTQVYPALTDPANTIYEPGEAGEEDEIVTLSERALAVNLHREFVDALGPHQADWVGAYWQELGWLFERLFDNSAQLSVLLSDRVFLGLLHSFAA